MAFYVLLASTGFLGSSGLVGFTEFLVLADFLGF